MSQVFLSLFKVVLVTMHSAIDIGVEFTLFDSLADLYVLFRMSHCVVVISCVYLEVSSRILPPSF